MLGGEGVKGLTIRAGAVAALALLLSGPFVAQAVAQSATLIVGPSDQPAVAPDLPPEVTWDDAYWAIPGADEAAAIVANTQAVAFAHAVVTQSLVNNVVTEQNVFHTALIDGSFNGNAGIVGVNQSDGNVNNQTNVRAFALTPGMGALQAAQADVLMEMHDNTLTTSGGGLTAGINNSFNNMTGVVGVNQVAGSLNEQANVLALSLGTSPGQDSIILDDATLALVGAPDQNTVNEDPNRPHTAGITNSFNNFTGIAQVNQVAGDLNRVSNVMALSVMVMP